MNTKFVNSSVKGDYKFKEATEKDEARKTRLKKEGVKEKDIKIEPIKAVLSEEKGILIAIGVSPLLESTEKDITLELYDENQKVAEISKNKLIKHCQNRRGGEAIIKWLKILPQHALEIEVVFEQRLEVIGDVSGLEFYFRN